MFRIFVVLSAFFIANCAEAQQDYETLSGLTVDDYRLGTHEYLVYNQHGENELPSRLSLWRRTIFVENIDGVDRIVIQQHWLGSPEFERKVYSVNAIEDFRPVYHKTQRGQENITEAFNFTDSEITGDPDVPLNQKANFSIANQPGMLNWELDLETFSLFDWEMGKTNRINYYHPGSNTPPKAWEYTVTGEEKLPAINGEAIDTWLVNIIYSETGYATFWLSKKTGEVLKMAEVFNGNWRFKVKLGVIEGTPANPAFATE